MSLSHYDKIGPLGAADASRVDFQNLKESYVSLNSANTLSIQKSIDPSVRVIIGKKGSGKTLYMKAIADYHRNFTERNDSVYLTDIDNEPPDTSLIVKVASWFKEKREREEVWRSIWKRVILRTALSHILYAREFRKYISNDEREEIIEEYGNLITSGKSPTSLFNELRAFLGKFHSDRNLKDFIYDEKWGPLEYEINRILKKSPPMYFFLDQLDDDFSNAPFHWLSCQYGLFSAIFRLIRNNTYGGRLHIVACMREIIYAYVLNTPHGNKYLSEPKIKVLRWNHSISKRFLKKKISSLADEFFNFPEKEKSLGNYFGTEKIKLKRHGDFVENVEDYILRHTMLMPRDIINVGNIFYYKINDLDFKGTPSKALKESVQVVAKQIAQEQMEIASILISTKWIYDGSVEDGTFNIFTDEHTIKSINDNLRSLIKSINKDRFSNTILKNRNKNLLNYGFSIEDNPFNSLFIAGLLGYVEVDGDGEKNELFFSESRNTQYDLPSDNGNYVLHSSLIDILNIKPIGKPVYAKY